MADFKFINNGENKIYNLSEEEILKAEDRMGIRFPDDLRQLYLEVGYG
ncbi:SMI1/KNR4 family protein, partial [Priestia megaterium]